jgi:hypothetical protein
MYYLTDPNQNTSDNLWVLDTSATGTFGSSLQNCADHTLEPRQDKSFFKKITIKCGNTGKSKSCDVYSSNSLLPV